MKKWIVSFSLLILFHGMGFSQAFPGRIDASLLPALHAHYQSEYTFDSPVNKQAWEGQKGGLHVSFVSTNKAWFRTEVPEQKETLS